MRSTSLLPRTQRWPPFSNSLPVRGLSDTCLGEILIVYGRKEPHVVVSMRSTAFRVQLRILRRDTEAREQVADFGHARGGAERCGRVQLLAGGE